MKPYSVLLLYPGYLRATDGESYYTYVTAENLNAAILAAQQEAATETYVNSPDDFIPLLVLPGHIEAEPFFLK